MRLIGHAVSRGDLLVCAAIAVAYFAVAELSLAADTIAPYLSPLWPASGLALAAVLFWGARAVPGVFIGSLAYQVQLEVPAVLAWLVAAANSVEVLGAAYLLDRAANNGHSFHNPRDFLVYAIMTFLAALAGSWLAVWPRHVVGIIEGPFLPLWGTRTMAHWASMLVISPAILLWKHHPRLSGRALPLVEGVLLSLTSLGASWFLFSGETEPSRANAPMTFLFLPLLMWPAVRMGLRETATILLLVAVSSLWGTLRGFGPFAALEQHFAITVMQAFLATLSLASITLASAVWRAKDDGKALAEARELLGRVTDAVPALIALIGPDFRYRFVNAAYAREFGDMEGGQVGKRVEEVTGPEIFAYARPFIERALAGVPAEFEAELPVTGKAPRWIRVQYTPYRAADGGVTGVVALGQDISLLKENEEALRRTERRVRALNAELERRVEQRTSRLKQVNDELEAFCYSVAHDLRSPLRKMAGFSEAVMQDYRGCLDERGSDYLKRIFDASRRMARLIDDMLDLSKVTRRDARDEAVDLSALAASLGRELKAAEPGRDVKLTVEPGLAARGDPGLLETALRNLLQNAFKFTRAKPRAVIAFGSIPQEPVPIYFVKDNGAGFEMTQAPKLFTAFERLHADQYPGTGIGLATVQRVVQRHGGRVWAEGSPGEGATFFFTLHER